MTRLHVCLRAALAGWAALVPSVSPAAVPDRFVVTLDAPGSGSCMQLAATLAPTSSVPATSPSLQVFFLLKDLRRGDVVSTRYTRPDGTPEPGTGAARPAHPQDSAIACWWDTLPVAGAAPAAAPGSWTATLLVNGTVVATRSFSIEAVAVPRPAGRTVSTIGLPAPPAATPPAKGGCTVLRLIPERAAEIRIPLDQIERIDWAPARNDGSRSDGLPEARRSVSAMQIHLSNGSTRHVVLVQPPQIRFICDAARP